MKIQVALVSMVLLSKSCTSSLKLQSPASLEGQEWSFARMNTGGIGGGMRWAFFPKNRFEYTSWYSGGAYWTRQYQGEYKYDDKEKKVFLKFDPNQNLVIDNLTSKMAVQLIISKKDTIPIITKSWDRESKENSNQVENLGPLPTHFWKQKFSIRKISTKKISK